MEKSKQFLHHPNENKKHSLWKFCHCELSRQDSRLNGYGKTYTTSVSCFSVYYSNSGHCVRCIYNSRTQRRRVGEGAKKEKDRERGRDRQTDRERERDRDRETDRQIDRQTDRQTDRATEIVCVCVCVW